MSHDTHADSHGHGTLDANPDLLHGHGHDDPGHGHGPQTFWLKYVFSTDHKIIGIQFLFTSLLFVIVGGLLALGVRYELAWPGQNVPHDSLLPGNMTNLAPENNLARWTVDGRVMLPQGLSYTGSAFADTKMEELESFTAQYSHVMVRLTEKTPEGEKVRHVAVTAIRDGQVQLLDDTGKASSLPTDAFTKQWATDAGGVKGVAVVYTVTGQKAPARDVVAAVPEDLTKAIADFKKAFDVPEGAYTRFDGFEGGLAVSIPVGTRIKGRVTPLAKPINAFVDKTSSVMADYRTPEGVRAVIGTSLREEGRAADSDPLVIEAGAAHQSIGPDPAILPLRPERTWIKLTLLSIRDKKGQYAEVAPVTLKMYAAHEEFDDKGKRSVTSDVYYEKQTLRSEAYNQLFTMHASVMIFFVIIPMVVGAFGNFLVPLMIGARDMAFPKLNMLSFWLAMPAGIVMIVSFWVHEGPAGGGWTMYPPLSSARFSGNLGTTLWIAGVALVGFSSIVGSLNYITTIFNMRAPGMQMFRMPLTVWAVLITSILALLATPVLTAAMIMLLLDRTLGTQFFADTILNGTAQTAAGGQPIMWQHLFWFYSHPAVYIMILPTMGVTSDIIATFARKPIFGYKPMVAAIGGIAFLGFIVWGHHMFQSGMNPVLGTTFMAATIMIAVPSAIKTFNWLGTLWGGNIKYTPSMLFALGFVSMFVIGGLSGIFMAAAPVDIHIHDTYFIVAHIHYVLFGGSMMGIFAGVYHWFPKMFGRQLNQRWGVIHFILTFVAFNGTFFMMHILGIGGHPRRYATILKYDTLEHLQGLNVLMTIFAMMLGTAQLAFFYNVFSSLPRRLGRAMTAFFIVGFFGPMVAGLSIWAARNGLGWVPGKQLTLLKDIISTVATQDPVWHYKGWAAALGYIGLSVSLIGLFALLMRGLHRAGRIAICVVLLPLIWVAIQFMGFGASIFGADGNLAADQTFTVFNVGVYLFGVDWRINWSVTADGAKMWHDIAIGLGHASLFVGLVIGVVWAVWELGRRAMGALVMLAVPFVMLIIAKVFALLGHELTSLEQMLSFGSFLGYLAAMGILILLAKLSGASSLSAPEVLKRSLYVLFIPAFLAPMLLKQETYMAMSGWPIIGWFVGPATFDARWLLLVLSALPGVLFLLAFKPQDDFGAVAEANPWHANSLDWCATTSPPLEHGNFETIPVVYRGPYEYSSPVTREDWLAQTVPLLPGEAELQAEGH
ncbi:MAG: cbb3-type cytochrome c oxidase subunit I [Phycisphaeraceae bacterium]